MSGGITATGVLAAAAVAGTAYSVYAGEEQKKAAKAGMAQAQDNAVRQEQQAEKALKAQMDATNKNVSKRADAASVRDAAALSGKAGQSGTMLTGAGGIDPSQLLLGKSTLLGG